MSTLRHLLDTDILPIEDISALFQSADELAQNFRTRGDFRIPGTSERSFLAAFLFMEPSTRTRLSFEVALHRLGGEAVHLGEGATSSIVKGESAEDTFWTVHALQPDLLIVRSGEDFPIHRLAKSSSVPIINAGHGSQSHPTQALLDLYTLYREWRNFDAKRVLFVGDLKHSRVIQSNLRLFARFSLELGICGPSEFTQPSPQPGVRVFEDLAEGLEWADACYLVRIQTERHQEATLWNKEAYFQKFGIDRNRLQRLKSDAVILHPGPANLGVEMSAEVYSDSRCRIRAQVENGVYLRGALMREWMAPNRKAAQE